MRYTIIGRNIEVTPGPKTAIEKKVGKLEHFFTPNTEIIVALSAQKDRQKVEVTIPVKGNTIHVKGPSPDMYVSIDLVGEIIERQIHGYRKKLIDKKQAVISSSQALIGEGDGVQGGEVQIVKTEKFAIKPATPKEACLQMEMLGYNFYVFLNANMDQMNVAYKHKNRTCGLIKPEL